MGVSPQSQHGCIGNRHRHRGLPIHPWAEGTHLPADSIVALPPGGRWLRTALSVGQKVSSAKAGGLKAQARDGEVLMPGGIAAVPAAGIALASDSGRLARFVRTFVSLWLTVLNTELD